MLTFGWPREVRERARKAREIRGKRSAGPMSAREIAQRMRSPKRRNRRRAVKHRLSVSTAHRRAKGPVAARKRRVPHAAGCLEIAPPISVSHTTKRERRTLGYLGRVENRGLQPRLEALLPATYPFVSADHCIATAKCDRWNLPDQPCQTAPDNAYTPFSLGHFQLQSHWSDSRVPSAMNKTCLSAQLRVKSRQTRHRKRGTELDVQQECGNQVPARGGSAHPLPQTRWGVA